MTKYGSTSTAQKTLTNTVLRRLRRLKGVRKPSRPAMTRRRASVNRLAPDFVMRRVCEDFEADLIEFSGEDHHVHLLVHYPPKVALSNLVDSLKGVSSRRLRQEFTSRVDRAVVHRQFWSGFTARPRLPCGISAPYAPGACS